MQKVISITTQDLEKQDPNLIPDDIIEYRTLTKEDLTQKIIEARQEIAQIKKNTAPNKSDILEALSKKDHYAIANELYALRQIIKDLKNPKKTTQKEPSNVIRRKNGESKEIKGKKRGRPAKPSKP